MRVINPNFKRNANAVAAVERQAITMGKILRGVSIYTKSTELFADDVKRQYMHFQTEDIENDTTKSIDLFWRKVAEVRGINGMPLLLI